MRSALPRTCGQPTWRRTTQPVTSFTPRSQRANGDKRTRLESSVDTTLRQDAPETPPVAISASVVETAPTQQTQIRTSTKSNTVENQARIRRSSGGNGVSNTERYNPRAQPGKDSGEASNGGPRQDLFSVLLLAQQDAVQKSAEQFSELVLDNSQRLMRGFEPVPAGYPPGPTGEMAPRLIEDPLAFLKKCRKDYGDAVTLILGGERVILIGDPALAHEVVVEKAPVFVKEGTAFFPGSSLAGNGLLVSDGDIWKRQRRLSNPAFRRSAVERYSQAMVTTTMEMLNGDWASDSRRMRARDVYADFNQLTFDITLETLFGQDVRSNSQGKRVTESIRVAFSHFTKRAANGFIVPEWIPSWDNLQYNASVRQLDSVVYSIISDRRGELERTSRTVAKDLLDSLILSRDEDGTGMSTRAMRDELMTLLVAGQETSAILLAWATACLAWNPKFQEQAAQEVRDVLRGSAPTAESVHSLPFCESVLLETMRILPPAYMLGRCAAEDVVLGNGTYHVKKGTTMLIAPYLLHTDPDLWKDSEAFLPSRWMDMRAAGTITNWQSALSGLGPNGAYMPFGGGPRNCIGTGIAMMEGLIVLAAILQKYDIRPEDPASPLPTPKPIITLRPDTVRVCLVPRK